MTRNMMASTPSSFASQMGSAQVPVEKTQDIIVPRMISPDLMQAQTLFYTGLLLFISAIVLLLIPVAGLIFSVMCKFGMYFRISDGKKCISSNTHTHIQHGQPWLSMLSIWQDIRMSENGRSESSQIGLGLSLQ